MNRIRNNHHATTALLLVVVLILSVIFSFFASSPEFHSRQIASLDAKKNVVMELMAASTTASIAITILPDDNATPIAEELANLSSDFLLILGAIFLEKYLLTTMGLVSFRWLIPIACILLLISLFRPDRQAFLKRLGLRLIAFAAALYLVVPISVKITNVIDETYSHSIQETIDMATQTSEAIESSTDTEKGITSFFSRFIDGVKGAFTLLQTVLNNFVEAVAVLIVTACVFPILTFMCCLWIIRLIWQAEIPLPQDRLPAISAITKRKKRMSVFTNRYPLFSSG